MFAALAGLLTAAALAAPTPQPHIISRSQWGARAPVGAVDPDPDKRRIIVHHTDIAVTPDMLKLTGQASLDASYAYARNIQDIHLGEGWDDIGYHFLVDWEGRILEGRQLDLLGAHSASANKGSIGIALMGDLDVDRPTERQLAGLRALLSWLVDKYDISPMNIRGHHDFDATACPGRYVEDDAGDALNARDPEHHAASPLKKIRCELLADRGRIGGKPDCQVIVRGDLAARQRRSFQAVRDGRARRLKAQAVWDPVLRALDADGQGAATALPVLLSR